MPDLSYLSDDDLIAHAREWRRRALHGDKEARGIAHALETEGRRRFGAPTTMSAPLDTRPLAACSRQWWRFW